MPIVLLLNLKKADCLVFNVFVFCSFLIERGLALSFILLNPIFVVIVIVYFVVVTFIYGCFFPGCFFGNVLIVDFLFGGAVGLQCPLLQPFYSDRKKMQLLCQSWTQGTIVQRQRKIKRKMGNKQNPNQPFTSTGTKC